MLSSKYRIPKNQILNIIKRGKKIQGEFFDLKSWYDDTLPHSKFAVVVSKKVSKSAVVRNRAKRLIKGAIYHLLKENKFRRGNHVFLVRSFDENIKMNNVYEAIKSIL
jgi:ribonuclease P protein component